jgi:hypothetical protein
MLARAVRYSESSGRPLWLVLLREGLLSEDKLFRLLEAQLKLPDLSDDQLDGVVVAPELKQAITAGLAAHLGILPLERSTDGRKAALAMVDPTQDLSTLMPKLASHGVVEVRRFLIRFGTLRLGMDMFYNQAWEPGESAPLVDSPSKPEAVPPSKPEAVPPSKPEAVPPSKPEAVPPSKPEAVPPSKPEAVPPSKPEPPKPAPSMVSGPVRVQPPPLPPTVPPPLPPTVPPPLPPPLPPLPSSISQRTEQPKGSETVQPLPTERAPSPRLKPSNLSNPPRTTPLRIEPPPLPKQAVPLVVGAARSGPLRRRPVAEKPGAKLSSADLIIEERPSNLNLSRDALRFPARQQSPEPLVDFSVSTVTDALFRCATTLADELSRALDSDWPMLLTTQCGRLCDRLGLLPRAQRELMLVARLIALLKLQVYEQTPPPLRREDRLGFVCDAPLDGVLASLQSEFLDFVRLPQDDDPPLGVRIISTVVEALKLVYQGHSGEALAEKLHERCGETEVVRVLLALYSDDPPQITDRAAPPGLRPAKLPPLPTTPVLAAPPVPSESPAASALGSSPTPLRLGWPSPAAMPDVPWTCERVSTLPEEGLLPYPAPSEPKPTERP